MGSDCRKHKKGNARIAELFEDDVRIDAMKCRDSCKGPVVEVRIGKKKTLFKKVRGKKLRTALFDYVVEGTLSPALKKCRIGK